MHPPAGTPKVLLTASLSWHLRQTARAFEQRDALAGLWIADKNSTGVSREVYRRCWPFHLAMKPFYHLAPQIWTEKAGYAFSGLWRRWFQSQRAPACNVVQAIMGFATEPFDLAEKIGALKVVDCPNSHPTTYHGFWQRECDLWCPGEKVPVPRWMFARMNRELARADLILCPSDFVRDSMLLNGLPAAKCFVAPFGVDTGIFQPRAALPDRPRFICVGTICVRKGHQYLFRAFAKVKEALPEAELICVGDYKWDFRRERPRWESSFTHYPSLSHADLAATLRTCTAFVLPSLEEGFARVLSEAMAAGLPIIASHESGASTLVRDGVEGALIVPQDTDRLAEAMIHLAQDAEQNRRAGLAACERGASGNTWLDYGDRLLREYDRRMK